MHGQFTLLVLPVLFAAVVCAAIAFFAWLRRSASGALSFSLLMAAVAVWAMGYALELLSHDLWTVVSWDNVSWLGAAVVPTLLLIFVLQYIGQTGWLTRRTILLLSIEPLITLILVWTDYYQGLIESHFSLSTGGPFASLNMIYGPWYWINLTYSYLLTLVAAVLLCRRIYILMRSERMYIGQASALLVAMVVPWLGNALTDFNLNPVPYIDLTPFSFTISGLVFAWSLFRYRFLDIVPVAREVVFEGMDDAVIVVDEQNRVVDLNPAAQQFGRSTTSAIGRSFADVFPELCGYDLKEGNTHIEVTRGDGETQRYFDIHVSPLYNHDPHRSVAGRLIVLNDITGHVRAERTLRESEERFRKVFEEAPIGMALVRLDGVVFQVNKALCEMLGYTAQELAGSSLSAITHPDDVDKDGLLAVQMLKGVVTSYKVEKRYVRKGHETLWADLTTTLLRNQAGDALYSLIMLENIIERKRAKLLEEERHQYAYELHDGLAQVAASTHQHLQAFASHYPAPTPQAREELERILHLAQRSVKEARRLIAGLRPTALDDFGVATALRLLVETQRVEGWTIEYSETLGSERLPTTIENTLYGVACEALNNARKHAGTTRARVALERHDSKIRLEVQDWGSGFEPRAVLQEASLEQHMGLREMRERVDLVGGNFTLSSRPGRGTLVVVEVPLLLTHERSLL